MRATWIWLVLLLVGAGAPARVDAAGPSRPAAPSSLFLPPFFPPHLRLPRALPHPRQPLPHRPDPCAPFRVAGRAPRGAQRWGLPPRTVLRGGRAYAVRVLVDSAPGRPLAIFSIVPDTAHAPLTANSFMFLACAGYYNGSPISKAIPSRLVEGGALAGGRPGPGYAFPAEAAHGQYGRGTVIMVADGSAHDGARFLVLLDRITLPPRYTVLGTVSAGLASLDRLSRTRTVHQPDAQEQSLPAEALRIASTVVTAR